MMGKLRVILVFASVIVIGLMELINTILALPPSTSTRIIKVCDQVVPLPPRVEILIRERYASCPLLNETPEQTTILLLDNEHLFGRTGNNLIEFFHSLQYGRDKGVVVGMMQDSWPTRMITEMWMPVHDDFVEWNRFIEQTFCVRVFENSDQLNDYYEVIRLDSRELFYYDYEGTRDEYIEFQSHIIRALWRSYNNGTGFDVQHGPVRDMCSTFDAIFGNKTPPCYSVVHSRSLEKAGIKLMNVVSDKFGCDPTAALEMEPEYVKAVLDPLDMLHHPIVFITDHQRPEVLERLLADPEIGPSIRLIPSEEASWIGGDITLALLATVFIGNPASTFSGFIANSRVALGYNHNYMYRRKEENETWVDVCDNSCSFGQYLGTG